MKIKFIIAVCLILAISCDTNKQKNNICNAVVLPHQYMLKSHDSLSNEGGIIYVNPKDSLCKDSNVYTEIVANIWDRDMKKVVKYRILDNRNNWSCFLERLKCDKYLDMANASFNDFIEIQPNEVVKIPVESKYLNLPLKTVKASAFLISENDYGGQGAKDCIKCLGY